MNLIFFIIYLENVRTFFNIFKAHQQREMLLDLISHHFIKTITFQSLGFMTFDAYLHFS